MNKVYYNWEHIQDACIDLVHQLNKSNWKPDYIVGLVRGGLTPAVLLSQYTNIPMYSLKICLRDQYETESNLWMSEDAYNHKNILVVDDINDTGATISELKKDWAGSNYNKSKHWKNVWHNNVRFAVLTNNLSSKQKVDYSVWQINKAKKDCWIVHPWEEFWMPKVDF